MADMPFDSLSKEDSANSKGNWTSDPYESYYSARGSKMLEGAEG